MIIKKEAIMFKVSFLVFGVLQKCALTFLGEDHTQIMAEDANSGLEDGQENENNNDNDANDNNSLSSLPDDHHHDPSVNGAAINPGDAHRHHHSSAVDTTATSFVSMVIAAGMAILFL